jgi:hypothetical protein
MRPLRCSIREGFQGTSKWKRCQQCAWRLRPSRAASVAIRMRTGFAFGGALKARLISSRSSGGVGPWKTLILSSAWLVLGKDEDAQGVGKRRGELLP